VCSLFPTALRFYHTLFGAVKSFRPQYVEFFRQFFLQFFLQLFQSRYVEFQVFDFKKFRAPVTA